MRSTPTRFEDRPEFKRGQKGEHEVARWLADRGWFVLPGYAYKASDDDPSAPRLIGAIESIVIPDLMIASEGKLQWVEVKSFGYSPWNKDLKCHTHGWTARLHWQYERVAEVTGRDVWVVVWETGLAANPDSLALIGTGDLLALNVSTAEPLRCQCWKCRQEQDPWCRVYFERNAFRFVGNVDPAPFVKAFGPGHASVRASHG
jgi:hypothetical protein